MNCCTNNTNPTICYDNTVDSMYSNYNSPANNPCLNWTAGKKKMRQIKVRQRWVRHTEWSIGRVKSPLPLKHLATLSSCHLLISAFPNLSVSFYDVCVAEESNQKHICDGQRRVWERDSEKLGRGFSGHVETLRLASHVDRKGRDRQKKIRESDKGDEG